jgi:aminoglycoside phosphotransferase
MTEIPGLMACDEALINRLSKQRIVALLAEGMLQLHSVDISDCPFDMRLDRTIAEAGYRLDAGMVDEDDFDDERTGRTAESVFDELLDIRPDDEDVVFTHGDYCLPNILIDPDSQRISGFIDMGRSGMADRYQDLALAQRSTIYNLGAEALPVLWQTYGIEKVDDDRVAFYRLLDEFF